MKSLPEIAHRLFVTKARQERFAYWRSVPLRRQFYLIVAVFSLFATIGLLGAIISANDRTHLIEGAAWCIPLQVSRYYCDTQHRQSRSSTQSHYIVGSRAEHPT